jgi:hypothetical protein
MKEDEEFRKALSNKHVPILVLDQKWHRLFAVHGKTEEIKRVEEDLNALLARQGKLNTDLKGYKEVKNRLMDSVVQNMDGADADKAGAMSERLLDEDKRLLEETKQKIDEAEEELSQIPEKIRQTNEELMLLSMEYFYEKLRVNQEESNEIDEWIKQVRIDLKKNIIRKQNRDINNREIYAYLHDIFGPKVIDLFDLKYEEEQAEEEQEQEEGK